MGYHMPRDAMMAGLRAQAAAEPYAEMMPDVMMMMELGTAPSEIDRRLGLPDGTAREMMVGRWFERGQR